MESDSRRLLVFINEFYIRIFEKLVTVKLDSFMSTNVSQFTKYRQAWGELDACGHRYVHVVTHFKLKHF